MRVHARSSGPAAHEPWASIDDVAAHVGVRKDSIYRWIENRGLPATKVGKLWKLKLSEVDVWMRAQSEPRVGGQVSKAGGRGPIQRVEPRLVLVIDDEQLVRDSVSDFLTDEGHQVQVAADGDEAMSLLASAPRLPDLIILDLKMPRLNGWRFRERQLGDARLAAIPVIVVTSVAEANVAGAMVLKKPLRLDALAKAMEASGVPRGRTGAR
jgi:excisionase family DNA binding protein